MIREFMRACLNVLGSFVFCLVILLLMSFTMLGCKSLPPDVVDEVKAVQQKAEELSKAGDATPKEQGLGLALSDACWQILFRCGAVKDVPEDVRKRREERRAISEAESRAKEAADERANEEGR